ncbi:carbohydrate ABC transporter permease [Ferruginivarius sediminum]|uniref:Sugar ABC transporter permease n=1 Tax=Ferruginivarius sediminum TaxID=2661937 RepID=A0A369TCI1_9PROT|nr:sugar ABC transporter permease [Ferruginivarius sediminum]RDD60616.1 sugar ABC transporter permease [Ferruginivarius sediminum]
MSVSLGHARRRPARVSRAGSGVDYERRWGGMMLLPAVLVIGALSIVPLSRAVYSSFQQTSPLLPSKFIGLDNYIAVIESNAFFTAWLVTLKFTTITVVLTTLMAVISASVLNSSFRGSSLVKPLVLLPWAVPGVIAGVIWRWMFNNNYGAINTILHAIGVIDEYVYWLGEPSLALLAASIAQTWSLLPLSIILILAALQNIPEEQYEAARLDGANSWQLFRYVTFPYIRTAVIIVALYNTLMGLTAYDIVYTMTAGGPGTATSVISYFTWSISFTQLNIGQGAALATMMALVSIVFIVGLLRMLPKGALSDVD